MIVYRLVHAFAGCSTPGYHVVYLGPLHMVQVSIASGSLPLSGNFKPNASKSNVLGEGHPFGSPAEESVFNCLIFG